MLWRHRVAFSMLCSGQRMVLRSMLRSTDGQWDLHLPLVATHISFVSHNAVQINKDLANASLAQVLVEHACRILGHVLFLAAYDNASVR